MQDILRIIVDIFIIAYFLLFFNIIQKIDTYTDKCSTFIKKNHNFTYRFTKKSERYLFAKKDALRAFYANKVQV